MGELLFGRWRARFGLVCGLWRSGQLDRLGYWRSQNRYYFDSCWCSIFRGYSSILYVFLRRSVLCGYNRRSDL